MISDKNTTKQLETLIAEARAAGTWLAHRNAARRINDLLAGGQVQPQASLKTAFVSTYTIDPVVDYTVVEAAAETMALQTYIAPYGQMHQEILNAQSGLYAFAPDVTILAAEPAAVAESPADAAQALIDLAGTLTQTHTGRLIVANFPAAPAWPLHLLPDDRQMQLQAANRRLQEAFETEAAVQVFDLDGLAAYCGYANAESPQMQAMARVPFAESFLTRIAQKLTACLRTQAGLIRKCLVLDCDNTLWGGIIGEDGIDGIALGPDWPGREYVAFQRAILELYEQGVILAINSKNNEAEVLQVLREHPHSVLREEHFAAVCINWLPKPENMQCVVRELNIGADSLVFADDNPAEREIMRQMLPEVAVLDLPANPALYERALRESTFFAQAAVTDEDKKRGAMYAAQRQRTRLEKTAVSMAEYLRSLQMVCSIRAAGESDIKRAAQLTQRTNQFNLTTRRYDEAAIRGLLQRPDWNVYVLGLKDKFGDNGTVGLALVEKQADTWRIDTFLMSCRVIGRQAEEALVDRICGDAVEGGAATLLAEYIPTAKNDLVADFWGKMGFEKDKDDDGISRYHRDLNKYVPQTFEYLDIENR